MCLSISTTLNRAVSPRMRRHHPRDERQARKTLAASPFSRLSLACLSFLLCLSKLLECVSKMWGGGVGVEESGCAVCISVLIRLLIRLLIRVHSLTLALIHNSMLAAACWADMELKGTAFVSTPQGPLYPQGNSLCIHTFVCRVLRCAYKGHLCMQRVKSAYNLYADLGMHTFVCTGSTRMHMPAIRNCVHMPAIRNILCTLMHFYAHARNSQLCAHVRNTQPPLYIWGLSKDSELQTPSRHTPSRHTPQDICDLKTASDKCQTPQDICDWGHLPPRGPW